jgi:hypothetical protein
MGKLLSVLVLCLVLSFGAIAQNAVDDARIMTGNIPSPDAAIAGRNNLLAASELPKRNDLYECWNLGRLQEALVGLSKAVDLPAYYDTSAKVKAVNSKLGAYCGFTSGEVASSIQKLDAKSLRSFVEKELDPVLGEISNIANSEIARYNKHKGDIDKALKEKDKAVEKVNTVLQDGAKRSGIPNLKFK